MVFHGLQKLTLLDFPGKVAATVFTAGCNFRCPFCHNASLVTHIENDSVYTEEDILAFLRKRQGILDGICVTGGEPLMHEDLLPFLRAVKALGYAVKLDTNGTFPARLKALIDEGLVDHVAMDIKNSRERYADAVGCAAVPMDALEESIRFLMESNVSYEFRTTLVKGLHEQEDVEKMSLWIRGAKKYFLQNFVDSGDLIGSGMTAFSREELETMRKIAARNVPNVALRGV